MLNDESNVSVVRVPVLSSVELSIKNVDVPTEVNPSVVIDEKSVPIMDTSVESERLFVIPETSVTEDRFALSKFILVKLRELEAAPLRDVTEDKFVPAPLRSTLVKDKLLFIIPVMLVRFGASRLFIVIEVRLSAPA